jgi:dipeptidyl aminopeptidase/acylaminoacyl peptidase
MWWFLRSEQTEDYADARNKFQTRLIRQGPAPQDWQPEQTPPGVQEIDYSSSDLQLKAWINKPGGGNSLSPAVLFLHGGFAFAAEDWDQAEPFRAAGFVTLLPRLRGENGLPGSYSMFYNEVDDALAAAEMLAKQPGVDPTHLYVAGHSAGGTLALAMTSRRFRAAASFSGALNPAALAQEQPELVPFDRQDLREFFMRSPIAFAGSIKCPVRVYRGSQEPFRDDTEKLAFHAKAAGLDVEAITVPGDHQSSVMPAMRQAIDFFKLKR